MVGEDFRVMKRVVASVLACLGLWLPMGLAVWISGEPVHVPTMIGTLFGAMIASSILDAGKKS